MKKILFIGFVILGSLTIVIQTSAISESNKSSDASANAVKKSQTPKDLVYYKTLFPAGNGKGC